METTKLSRLFFRAFALIPFVAVGCQAIAGIEDRHYQALEGGAGDAGPKPSETCKTYCKDVMDACQGNDVVYTSLAACYGVCAKLPPGENDEAGGNTVACRDNQAIEASRGEPKVYCPFAGPGGGGKCGSDCESYCMLYADTCADVSPPLDNCLSACATLRRSTQFNAITDHDGDTLDCRLVHVSTATANPGYHDEHCPHSRLVPPTAPCTDPSDQAPTCDDYCHRALGACGVGDVDGGSLAQYESLQQCMDVCGALPRGKNNEIDGNSVGCRLYHSYNALSDAKTHCAHTGPTGDGHCAAAPTATDRGTDNCDPYCQIIKAACPSDFKTAFGTTENAHELCHTECAKLSGAAANSGYSIGTPDGPTVQCRVLHATRAFQDPAECAAAFGEEICK